MGNIIRDGVVMLVFLFIIIACWLILSGPFEDIVSEFEDVNLSASDTHVEESTGWIRSVWDIFFAAMGVVPIIWFIMRCFMREPEWR